MIHRIPLSPFTRYTLAYICGVTYEKKKRKKYIVGRDLSEKVYASGRSFELPFDFSQIPQYLSCYSWSVSFSPSTAGLQVGFVKKWIAPST